MIYLYIPFLIGLENRYQSIDLIMLSGVYDLFFKVSFNCFDCMSFFHMYMSFSCWSIAIKGKGWEVLQQTCWFVELQFVNFLPFEFKNFHMCASFSCWSDSVRVKSRGCRQKPVDFIELQFVHFQPLVFKFVSYCN